MKTQIIIKHTFLVFAFFIGAATVALAQPFVSFAGIATTITVDEPTPNGGNAYEDYIITINISATPASNVLVMIDYIAGPGNSAENPGDYELLSNTVTFTNAGGTTPQTIIIRVYDEEVGDEDVSETFTLVLSIVSGPAMADVDPADDELEVTILDDAILPIDLVYFHGRALPNTVELFWQTATEKNNAYMAVERSGDGLHFVEIGQVKPANGPNSSVSQVYKLVDTQPLAAINYYRLRQVDLDEKYTYHLIIAVDYNGKTLANITLQNNLATADQIQVFFNEFLNGQATLVVVDLNGRIVQQATISADTAVYTVSTTQLAKGYYTVQVQTRTTRDAIQFVKM